MTDGPYSPHGPAKSTRPASTARTRVPGGYYSLYLYMRTLAVRDGDQVGAGQVLGGVGGTTSPEGPHIEFQILQPGAGGEPRPVDPVRWLESRS